jgi:NAD(P)-dependent dehydrogenase (short-subunit alcohol dehydrogenase family)
MAQDRRNAIITGAASGLGRALAVRLARDGWNIAVCDINDQGSQQTLEAIRSAGGDGLVEHLDVSCEEDWQTLSDRLRGQWDHLELLVNNAGIAISGEVGQTSLDDWRWALGINLWNGIYGCHTFVDWLKANPRGAHIVNTASLAAIGSAPSMAAYNVTKSGILALSETLFAELMPHNVGVTVLCPAFVKTALLDNGRFAEEKHRTTAVRAFEKSDLTAEQVAEEVLRAIRRKQLYVILPRKGRLYWYFKRLSPQRFARKMGQMYARDGGPRDRI